ncbi:MAG: sugar-binding domain-containing protein, partial [Chloroflexota bacterium]
MVLSTRHVMSLDGQWEFALDPQDLGIGQGWSSQSLNDQIRVPASWAEAGFGEPPQSHFLAGWNPVLVYEGAAWYSRLLDAPTDWSGQIVELVLKGVRWRSTVWLDGTLIGHDESLSTPHHYDLTPHLKSGSGQRLTIQVDNRMLYPLDESHANSEQTSTHWGGITGGAEIILSPQSRIQSVKCSPDVGGHIFNFDVTLQNAQASQLEVTLTNPETQQVYSSQITVEDDYALVSIELGSDARLWWDDDPFLYNISVNLKQGDRVIDQFETLIGLREISTLGKQILLNGKPVFLRGYVDCSIFPQTGYPSWDIEHYRRQLQIARSYGFNHVRLHSWTAPEPFWQAADEVGMLVQAELPHWSRFYTDSAVQPPETVHQYLLSELERIIEVLNLHPSWVMFSNGNELIGPDGHPALTGLSTHGKALDSTRLFTDQTGFGQLPSPARTVDYYIQSCNWHPPKKIYDAASNDTTQDFSAVTS